ncbi:related to ARV1-protein functioning in transport of glycosylphosphatidylinositol intermediates into ER lumen [Sporisorium reilianum f. sp. reilianum]|uniref:Protein ARV n=1 Tax=Sporisorium reilianum f. sp. reilianum TaxID=72559 RepID=A0A2N8UA46_9BASI|nr:related to ARV1-protein functioning in transport of glycosylphosphatidylinositol intermediates into ER lumen [Sporisorium reilianum f. sp. reilianum]
MPICIHCATPIESLYMRYGQDHIVLSPCTSDICAPSSAVSEKSSSSGTKAGASAVVLADEYLEHDLPIVIIDLILAKPQAYRHLLFNRPSIFASASSAAVGKGASAGTGGEGWGREVWELVKRILALSLVDAYIRWFYMCVQPPLQTFGDTQDGTMKLSEKLMEVVQMQLPMQAGMFFPSLFTPRTTLTQDRAIRTVCSAAPLWNPSPNPNIALSTPISYLNVLAITLAESTALHLSLSTLTRHLTPNHALLLSQLSPLLLLTFVLLWSTKFPHSDSPPPQTRGYMVWVIRTFLASLNAGVAIATVIKGSRRWAWAGRAAPALILAVAWSAQAVASAALYAWLS